MNYQYHPFHMVLPSMYPLLFGLGIFTATVGTLDLILMWPNLEMIDVWLAGLSGLAFTWVFYQWVNKECYEGAWYGCHTWYAQVMYRMGWLFFVLSEVMIFFSFFWAFFFYSLSPAIELGVQWVPSSIILINPFHVPMLNTVVLLSSGVTATLSHYYFLMKKYNEAGSFMTLTLVLGVYFSLLQLWEYTQTFYTISDSVFGSIFFMSTGMHGCHVMGGTVNLFIARWRMTHYGWSELINFNKMSKDIKDLFDFEISSELLSKKYFFYSQFTYYSHLNLELGIWYWHFVDVIWLFLYSIMYCWVYFK